MLTFLIESANLKSNARIKYKLQLIDSIFYSWLSMSFHCLHLVQTLEIFYISTKILLLHLMADFKVNLWFIFEILYEIYFKVSMNSFSSERFAFQEL